MTTFADSMRRLLARAEIKHATLAKALQYDESYISKWLSGKARPSSKNVEKVIRNIADCIVSEVSTTAKENLKSTYEVSGEEELLDAITGELIAAYTDEIALTEGNYAFYADDSLLSVAESISWEGKQIILMADLFSMEHESRLLMAGIRNGHFENPLSERTSVDMIINLDSLSDVIYDPIYLVHLLASYSNQECRLYGSDSAVGKLLYSDGCTQVVSAMLTDHSRCMAVTNLREAATAIQMRQMLKSYCKQETQLFQSMDDLLEDHFYLRSLMSEKLYWLTGHFTEQLVPEALYLELGASMPEDATRIRKLLKNAINNVRVLLYRSAFSKLLSDGELDFFNRKIVLNHEQQGKCLQYILELVRAGQVRIIDSGFSMDFQYITDPCIFLSDSVDYVRLENGCYENNLFRIADSRLSQIYHQFYLEAWSGGESAVICDKPDVLKVIDSYIKQWELLK